MGAPRGTLPPYERILARLAKEYPEGLSWEECWPWPGSVGSHGYGQISYNGRPELVHRVIFDAVHGLIPEGHKIDHTCHNEDLSCSGGKTCQHRRCANWFHIVAKSNKDNLDDANRPRQRGRFKTHCPKDHPYDDENTMWVTRVKNGNPINERQCKACNRDRVYKAKHGVERPADAMESLSRAGCATCARGHAYDEQNTIYTATTGKRRCKKCERLNDLKSKWKKKTGTPLVWYSVQDIGQWGQDGYSLERLWGHAWSAGNFNKNYPRESLTQAIETAGGVLPEYALSARRFPDGSTELIDGVHRWGIARDLGITQLLVDVRIQAESPMAWTP